jgi:hypothetical protein
VIAWTVLTLFLLGLLLVVEGVRQRAPDGRAYCGRCGFALAGLAGPTCPECGALLGRRRGVAVGSRRARPLLVIAGALLILVTAAVGGAFAIDALGSWAQGAERVRAGATAPAPARPSPTRR